MIFDMIGDSITLSAKDELEAAFTAAGHTIRVRAGGGWSAGHVACLPDSALVQTVYTHLALDYTGTVAVPAADRVIVALGTNDALWAQQGVVGWTPNRMMLEAVYACFAARLMVVVPANVNGRIMALEAAGYANRIRWDEAATPEDLADTAGHLTVTGQDHFAAVVLAAVEAL
jgi:hypothetical protein